MNLCNYSLDPADYMQLVMTLLFLKRLNDTFEENAERLIKEGKSQKEAYDNKNRHYFFIPKEARWSVLSTTSENIGEQIDHVCKIIEWENPDLDVVLTNTKYNDKRNIQTINYFEVYIVITCVHTRFSSVYLCVII